MPRHLGGKMATPPQLIHAAAPRRRRTAPDNKSPLAAYPPCTGGISATS